MLDLKTIILVLITTGFLLIIIGIAYFIITKRKVMGAMQRWHGPAVLKQLVLLQPLADGCNLVVKKEVKMVFLSQHKATKILNKMYNFCTPK